MSRSRNYCFTVNVDDEHANWETDFAGLCDLAEHSHVRGLIFQEEIGGNTERQHYQGFIRLLHPKTLRQMRELFEAYLGHQRTHLEQAVSPKAAVEYCRKGQTRLSKEGCWEFGDLEFEPGKRNDLLEIKKEITNPEWKHATLYTNYFGSSVRYMQGIEKAAFYLGKSQQKEREVEVCWLWGKSGAGKSRDAREGLDITQYFRLPTPIGGRLWFDGYEREKVLIIEEFNQHTMPIETFLELVDRYPLQIPIKGAFVWAAWTKVIVTSQFHYSTIYPFCSAEQQEALSRRISITKAYNNVEVLERNPEAREFFQLRNVVSHTVSHRDIPAGAEIAGALPMDSGEDSPLEVTRSERSTARRRVLVEDSPHCTQTQLCERDELEERDVRCWEHMEAAEETHCSDSGEQSVDEPGASQQYAFSFPGYRSEEL